MRIHLVPMNRIRTAAPAEDGRGSRPWSVAVALMLVALLAGGFGLTLTQHGATPPADGLRHVLWPEPRPIPRFALSDHTGAAFDRSRLLGRWTFLFFGYTSCPDVCPTTLAVLADIARSRGSLDVPAQDVFVSVDPERDGAQRLGAYVRHFREDFIGVHGFDGALKPLLEALNVMVVREPSAGGAGLISHTSAIMLVDPQARVVAAFSPPHDAGVIVRQFAEIRQYLKENDS